MDTLRRKCIEGTATEESYRLEAVKMTIKKLKLHHQYHFVKQIGAGTFGNVIEVNTGEATMKLAVKIVLKDCVSRSEINLWPRLKHSNIVPLLEMIEFKEAHTYTFIMPKCRTALDQAVEDIKFIANPKGLKILTFWLQNIVDGIAYLHSQDLCHLDLKCNNILISDIGYVCICDFGFAQSTKEVLSSFGSPLAYRPPEASCDYGKLTPVDGQKYDVWTLGLLALEMFTRLSLWKSACELDPHLSNWPDHIYPRIYRNLQEDEFQRLIEDASPFSKLSSEMMDDVRNLITSCLNLDPRNRPSVAEIREYGMFGGLKENVHRNHPGDIWEKYTSSMRIRLLLRLYCREKENSNRQEHLTMEPVKESDKNCGHNIETGKGDAPENVVVKQQTAPTTDKTDIGAERLEQNPVTDEDNQNEEGSKCVTETLEHISTRQKIRLWFKDKRSKIRRLFTCCVPVRKSRR